MATLEELEKAQAANTNTTSGTNTVATTPGENKVNAIYDAQKEAQLGELKAAYDLTKSEYEAAQKKIAPQYQMAANDLAVQYERDRQNFNQQAAANGINTGTASQTALARQGQYQRDFGSLRTSEAEAQNEATRNLAALTAKYQTDVATKLSNNEYQRAAALYQEYQNAQSKDLQDAQILAEFGDFSGYAKLYGQEQADNMFYIWASQNPQLAYNAGRITKDQRDNLLNNRPINDGLDENGVRIASAASSSSGGGGVYYDGSPQPVSTTGYMGKSATGGNIMYTDPADALASILNSR